MMKLITSLCCVLSLVGVSAGQGQSVKLGRAWRDDLLGYQIRRPADCQTIIPNSVSELVRFNVRDAKTGAVYLSTRVLQAQLRSGEVGKLDEYANHLTVLLKQQQGLTVDPAKLKITTYGGKPAIDLQGPVERTGRFYNRQIWVQTGAKTFLVFSTTGPLDAAAAVSASSQACIDTLRIFDPTAARAKLSRDIVSGAELLKSITPEKFNKAMSDEDCWLWVKKDDKTMGFVHYHQESAEREGTRGVLVVSETALVAEDGAKFMGKQANYVSNDRQTEIWESIKIIIESPGTAEQVARQAGKKQGPVLQIVSTAGKQGEKNSTVRVVPDTYLPQAMGSMLYRLLDRSKPGSHAFDVLNPEQLRVDLRTVTVVGPKDVVIDGQTVKAVLLTDKLALDNDTPTANVWVDDKGMPFLVESPSNDGGTDRLVRTTERRVRGKYPAEWLKVRELGR